MITTIGEIYEEIPCVDPQTKSLEVHQIFKTNPNLQGIVVKEKDRPIALVMRALFYQKIGGLYGYNLYMGRTIDLVMNNSPLIVDSSQPIVTVSQQAMERPEEELYDYVIVTQDSKYLGIVSIQNLLLTFAKIQKETARFMNPLTGLPGNNLIDQELTNLLDLEHFSVLYVDLDHFKTYNDTYGFKNGDELILATARILTSSHAGWFVGHIGGDDFIILLDHYDYMQVVEKVITDFDETVRHFYSETHWNQKCIVAETRSGKKESIPLVSISIAVVTNQDHHFTSAKEIIDEATSLKKECKKHQYSCYKVNVCSCTEIPL